MYGHTVVLYYIGCTVFSVLSFMMRLRPPFFFAFPVLQWPGVLVEVFLKLMFFNLVLTDLIGVIHCVVVPEFLYQCQF